MMLNLQTLAESLASRCQGRAWIFVTSQGDLATVLGEMGTTAGNDFTKIQGRFTTLLNLTSQDVAEVICRRLLAKAPPKPVVLSKLYTAEAANLKTLFKFGDESRDYRGFADEEDFCAFYPFHPYQFELLQGALITLSKHNFFTGKAKSIGERSMLGILQDVGKGIAKAPIGQLATFDTMFEGLRGALRGDLQTAIQTAERNLGGAHSLPVRLLKALFLLKYVNEFKATPRNLAILLIDQCHVNIADHEKAVRQALAQLEGDTYIQRNGNAYEFLTDDEKDVETEIKGTDVDESEVSELFARIAYDDIIRDTKLRFEDNKQDYPFTRRLDGQVWGKREYDLAIHIASDLHESYADQTALVNQSMGKSELLLILPSDPRLVDDLRLFLKTDKYYRQNYSPTLPETRARILRERQQSNNERLRPSLEERLRDALCKARMVLNGSDLTNASSDPRNRVAKGFQDLVRFAFPSLRMIRRQFTEADLQTVLSTPADDFFKSDDGTLGEAEQEILLRLQQERAKGTRISVVDMLTVFEKRTYGWPQIATQCLLARLFMRGRVELRQGGNLLDATEVYTALSNNRQFAQTIITLQEQFDAAAVAKLKTFHRDFFDQANPGSDAKDVALAFQRQMEIEAVELEKLASHAGTYPFFAALTPVANELRALADREWSHCLKDLDVFKDKLLDTKEQTIDPLKQFYKGAKKQIYDDIVSCLRSEEPNVADVSGNEYIELKRLVATDAPYKGNGLQQAKAKLDVFKANVTKVVAAARAQSMAAISGAEGGLRSHPDFAKLSLDEQKEVLAPFATASAAVESERLVPVIRQSVSRVTQELVPAQMQRVSEYANEKRKKDGSVDEGTPPAPAYVAAQKIPVSYSKRVLESEADLDAYLAALRACYVTELKAGKRITL
jgi:hypothetical protein